MTQPTWRMATAKPILTTAWSGLTFKQPPQSCLASTTAHCPTHPSTHRVYCALPPFNPVPLFTHPCPNFISRTSCAEQSAYQNTGGPQTGGGCLRSPESTCKGGARAGGDAGAVFPTPLLALFVCNGHFALLNDAEEVAQGHCKGAGE